MLALTGGSARGARADVLARLPYASFLFDLIHGPDDWRVIASAARASAAWCAASWMPPPTIGDEPEILVWAAHYAASTGVAASARVGLSTAGGLAGVTPEVAARKLRALAEGARIAALPRDEAAASLDPRALDLRSAALSSWSPDPRLDRRRSR